MLMQFIEAQSACHLEHGFVMSQDKKEPISIDLDFAPSWARQSPEEALKRYARDSYDGDGGRRDTRGRQGDRAARGERSDRYDRPRREASQGGFEKVGRRPREEKARFPTPASAPSDAPRAPQGERPPYAPDAAGPQREPRGPYSPRPEPVVLPFDLRLLPEQKALGAVIRRIQTTHRAYPLRDIAHLFLDNPASCLVRIELRKDQPQEARVYQCKVCGRPALSEEEIAAHIAADHLDHFFTVADVEAEAPSGNFTCVARCGLSGTILGPPNHHSYAAQVQNILRTRYPNMSPEAYHSRIEIIREPEAIEQWRELAKKRRIYRLKQDDAPAEKTPAPESADNASQGTDGLPDGTASEADKTEIQVAPAMERDAAERWLQREIVPGQIASTRSLVATVDIVRQTPSQQIGYALREALFRENKFPASLFFALRGAFRHRKLCLFRANNPRGPDFVVAATPAALNISHATEDLRLMLGFVADNPGCSRQELLTAIAADDEAKQQTAATALTWLVERGHLIEYYNGVLCAPMEHPKFRYLSDERPDDSNARESSAKEPKAEASVSKKPVVKAKADEVPVAAVAEIEAPVVPPDSPPPTQSDDEKDAAQS